jgi:4-amino-4-deoxy-L-arabinose transferase-like glycosyltransferase
MALFGILAVLALGFLGMRGLWEPDEGRYVEVAREMLLSGNYLVPTLNQVPHFTKPPLTYWVVAAGLHVLGWNEWGARLYLAIAFVATSWLTAWLGVRLWRSPGGHRAGLVFATMLLPFVSASVVTTDALLLLFETAALACFWAGWTASRVATARRSMAGFWGCLGLAFLTKGPPALLPVLIVAAFLGLVRRREDGIGWRTWLAPTGLGLFLLLAVPWFLVVTITHDGLLHYFVWREGIDRVISHAHRRNSRWYMAFVVYGPTLLLGALPWWLAVRPRAAWIAPRAALEWLRADARRLFLALWIAVPVGVLSLASSRLPFYLLPVFPALALAIAGGRRLQGTGARRWWTWVGLWVTVLLGLRLGSAWYATASDSRAMARWIAPHLGIGPVEVVVIDQPVYGLAFYLGVPVELITGRQRGAPEYWPPERWATELAELPTTPRRHLFLVRTRSRDALARALAAVPAACREVATRSRRHLIVCDPGSDPPSPRLALWLETPPTAGGRYRAMDHLRELDEWRGLDRVVVMRHPIPGVSLRRLLDGYQAWPLESRGVPVDIVESGRGLLRGGSGSAARVLRTPGPTLDTVVYGVTTRPGSNRAGPPSKVGLLTRCGDPSEIAEAFGLGNPARGMPQAGVGAVLVLCRDGALGSRRDTILTLMVGGATGRDGTPEMVGLSVDQLRGRILIAEFGPAGMDIVLATPDYRDVALLHRLP